MKLKIRVQKKFREWTGSRMAPTPTALDVRDDRINLFVDANSYKQTYYYAVRAVSPGVYKMGPVSADAMYNGEYHSYNGAGVIKVCLNRDLW